MVKPVEPRTVALCQATKMNGYPCGSKAIHEVHYNGDVLQLCRYHVDWRPETHKGRVFRNRKMTNREKRKRDVLRKRTAERCVNPNKNGEVCQAPVTKREGDRPFCYYHWRQYVNASAEQRSLLDQRMIEAELFRAAGQPVSDEEDIKAGKRRFVADMPDDAEQLAEIAARMPVHGSDHPQAIQFREAKPRGMTLGKAQFLGIDVEHYTPDFKYDFISLLYDQIRRAHAVIRVLEEQLMRIEAEEESLKRVETHGTMMNDKGQPVEFNNTTTRHVTPIETKLLLIDKLTKHEAHLAKLMKQLEELPVTCLSVFRKMGVKWDRQAAQMVIDAIETDKLKTVESLDVQALPTSRPEVLQVVNRAFAEGMMSPEQVATQKGRTDW